MKSPRESSPQNSDPLPSSFFHKDTAEVARRLLGKGIYVVRNKVELLAEIVEVEAYLGERDPASHAYKGPTPRNWPMFEAGGTCYVYRSYGVHWCMNVVTRGKGEGEAVLLRAGVPLLGVERMRKNRGVEEDRSLLSGPGKFCEALGIDISYNGVSFDREDFKLIDFGRDIPESNISQTPRIGITKAAERPLRFCIRGSQWLSRKG